LDCDCERVITDFLWRRHSKVDYPITTDDLTVLIESAVEDFDPGADLSNEPGEVEGVTEFFRGRKPNVKISRLLSESSNRENRYRTTLTHEFGHVHFHDFMFQVEAVPLSLFDVPPAMAEEFSIKCKRENIVAAPEVDWMEWQAGFACGAILIPITPLSKLVQEFRITQKLGHVSIADRSEVASLLISEVTSTFHTSMEAARVRLLQRQFILHEAASRTGELFAG
jgi:hypothetical protein